MSKLPLIDAIPRFKENEERVDVFANGSVDESYTTRDGRKVPSLSKFHADVNELGSGWLADAQAWAESPTAPGDPGTKSAKTWAGIAVAAVSSTEAFRKSTPSYYGAPMNGVDSDNDAIDAAIAGTPVTHSHSTGPRKVVVFTKGNYLLTRAVEIPPHTEVVFEGGTYIKLADFAYDNMFRSANARAMRRDTFFTTDDLGNPYRNDSGIRAAVAAYTTSANAGDVVAINGFRYEALAAGHPNYNDLPADMIPTRADNLRFRPAMDEHIYIRATGKVILDGNGLYNRSVTGRAGYREPAMYLGFCRNYSVSGITFHNTSTYGISNEHVEGGKFQNITMDQPGWQGRTIPVGDPGWRSEVGMPNQDGINLRKGCRSIIIDGLFGRTSDDCVALTNLYPTDLSIPEKDNHLSSNYAPYGSDTRQVTINNIYCRPIGTHHVVRITSGDNNKICFVYGDGIYDFTDQQDVEENQYGRVEHECCVLVGDTPYGGVPSGPDAIYDIHFKNVFTTARIGMLFKGPSSRCSIDGLTMVYDKTLGRDSAPRRRYAISFYMGGPHGTQQIESATQTNPVEITTKLPHGLTTGKEVIISGLGSGSMPEINHGVYTITVTGDKTYTLDGVDGTGFTAFTPDPDRDYARDKEFLRQLDHSFSNINFSPNTFVNGEEAGFVVDVRDGTRLMRSNFSAIKSFSARSFMRLVGAGSAVLDTKFSDIELNFLTGSFVQASASSDYASSNGQLSNVGIIGRSRINYSGLDGPVGRFYGERWFLSLDEGCPSVTADDVEPPALPRSAVQFESNTGKVPVLTLMKSRGGVWVHENRSWGQPVFCNVDAQVPTGSLTLNSGMNMGVISTGQRISFIPPDTNTDGIGIRLDGANAIACRTINGSVVPVGYLRAGVMTEAWFDGTNWIVDREVEYLSGTDSDIDNPMPYTAMRMVDGRMEYFGSLVMTLPCTNESGSIFTSNTLSRTFAVPFKSFPRATVEMGNTAVRRDVRLTTLTSIHVKSFSHEANSSTTDVIPFYVNGFWY